ncbi:unnamed protein product [Ilex paraguariensis]|uniref:Uncharacterized protein n=1 Tax=Ilex paraguariensis TaxID=185542 RepID=A0ABC8SMT3_9AQUA
MEEKKKKEKEMNSQDRNEKQNVRCDGKGKGRSSPMGIGKMMTSDSLLVACDIGCERVLRENAKKLSCWRSC